MDASHGICMEKSINAMIGGVGVLICLQVKNH